MKKTLTIMCAILGASALMATAQQTKKQPSAKELFDKGQIYYTEQKFEEARQCFLAVVKTVPKHRESLWYLEQISRAELAKYGTKLERMMTQIILPEIAVTDGRIEEVMQRLRIESKRLTQGKFQPNFVVKKLSDTQKEIPINFRLRNVSLKDVLAQLTALTGAHFDYGTHLIAVRDKAPALKTLQLAPGQRKSQIGKGPSKLQKGGESPTLRKDGDDADDPFGRNKYVLKRADLSG